MEKNLRNSGGGGVKTTMTTTKKETDRQVVRELRDCGIK